MTFKSAFEIIQESLPPESAAKFHEGSRAPFPHEQPVIDAAKAAMSKVGGFAKVTDAEFEGDVRIGRELVIVCNKFIKDNHIRCEESISQSDRVIENAYEFIADICNIVGYWEDDQ